MIGLLILAAAFGSLIILGWSDEIKRADEQRVRRLGLQAVRL